MMSFLNMLADLNWLKYKNTYFPLYTEYMAVVCYLNSVYNSFRIRSLVLCVTGPEDDSLIRLKDS